MLWFVFNWLLNQRIQSSGIRGIASPLSRPLGETDAPAPVRAEELIWDREGDVSHSNPRVQGATRFFPILV
jgi:hypothetical protein